MTRKKQHDEEVWASEQPPPAGPLAEAPEKAPHEVAAEPGLREVFVAAGFPGQLLDEVREQGLGWTYIMELVLAHGRHARGVLERIALAYQAGQDAGRAAARAEWEASRGKEE